MTETKSAPQSSFIAATVLGAALPAAIAVVTVFAGGFSYVVESLDSARVIACLIFALIGGCVAFPFLPRGLLAGLACGAFGTPVWLLAWRAWVHIDPFLRDTATSGPMSPCLTLYAFFLFWLFAPVGIGAALALWAIVAVVRRQKDSGDSGPAPPA